MFTEIIIIFYRLLIRYSFIRGQTFENTNVHYICMINVKGGVNNKKLMHRNGHNEF